MCARRNRKRVRLPIALALATALLSAAAAHAQLPAFIPMPGVTPEGVAVDRTGDVFVSVRSGAPGTVPHGAIWRYTPDGQASLFADVGEGVIGGLAIAANGDVYVAMATGPDQGVYRIDRMGVPERLPGTAQIVFANALAFDARGDLYVTESYSGAAGSYGPGGIWRVPRRGEAELWLRHELLTGIGYLGYPIGANGIGYYHGDLYVANTDKGIIVRVPVLNDGSAGEAEAWKRLEAVAGLPPVQSPLPVMPDGLAFDVHGNVYVTVVSRNSVVRVNAADRSQETIALLMTPWPDAYTRAPLDTPASLAFGTGAGEQQMLFVTNLGWMSTLVPGPTWPGPGLVKVDAGVPGRPLH